MTFKFSKPMQAKFLDALARLGNVEHACAAVDVSWQLAYRTRERNPKFRARWAEVIASAFDKHVAKRAKAASTEAAR